MGIYMILQATFSVKDKIFSLTNKRVINTILGDIRIGLLIFFMDFSRFKKQDYVITAILITLIIIGSFVIYSSTYNTLQSDLVIKQLILVVGGLTIYFLLTVIDIDWFKVFSIQLLLYCLILGTLIYVNFFGATIAGTNRWIDLGFFAFQPSEYSKIIIILMLAFLFGTDFLVVKSKDILVKKPDLNRSFKVRIKEAITKIWDNRELKLSITSSFFIVPLIFFTFIQPALGNSIIMLSLWLLTLLSSFDKPGYILKNVLIFFLALLMGAQFFNFDTEKLIFYFSNQDLNYSFIFIPIFLILIITYISKIKWWQTILTVFFSSVVLISGIVGWGYLGDYQKIRVQNFVAGPETDPLGSGYQVIQSKIAIGSGQVFGRGYLQGTQSSLHILTQAETDFAFASLGEQFGFVGSILVLAIYLFLIIRILKVSKETPSKFGTIICFGVVNLLLIHLFINIGMNIGQLPVTGIPLPLISYGGSSVIMTFILMGLVQAVYTSRKPVDMADSLMLTSLRTAKN